MTKSKVRSAVCGLITVTVILFILASPSDSPADDSARFASYRSAIQEKFGIDIREFKGKIEGGKADGKQVTRYDLNQLLMGIAVEQEHTKDKLVALEIATDHLEEFPDYYTRLHEMEEQAEKEMEARKKGAKQ